MDQPATTAARRPTPDHAGSRAPWSRRLWARSRCVWLGVVSMLLGSGAALAQVSSPVYLDTSTRAIETLDRLDTLIASGNATEGARAMQVLLDEHAMQVAPGAEAGVSVSVRARVHTELLARPALLSRYRELFGAASERLLRERGDDPAALAELVRRFGLTSAGAEGALRLAQWRTERADFDAAWWTLHELEDHPDRVPGGLAADAARLAATLSRYIPERAGPVAERWVAEAEPDARPDAARDAAAGAEPPSRAGGDAPVLAAFRPARAAGPVRDAFSANDPIRYEELVPQPVGSMSLLTGADDAWSSLNMPGTGPGAVPAWVAPVVTDDRLYINDGLLIGAWDRFTLRPIWRTTLGARAGRTGPLPVMRRNSTRRQIEDVSTVAVDRDLLVAPGGLAISGGRRGDPRVHAFDARTGERRWAVSLGDLHPDLRLASVRGRPVITGDLVLLGTRTSDDGRRLVVVRLIALDRATGRLVWMRTLGSAGAQYQAPSIYSDMIAVHAGVAYLGDEIGVLAAVRVDNGEPRWVRAMPGVDGIRTRGDPPAFANVPVIVPGARDPGDTLVYTLSPDRDRVLALDSRTGRVHAERESDALGSARYLVRAAEHLVGVGPTTLASIRLIDFVDPGVRSRTAPRRNSGAFEGRAVAAGDDVVVPTGDGLLVYDPRGAMDEPSHRLGLDTTGGIVLARGQVVTVDRSGTHTYLVWGEASAMLNRRIASSPDDPGPAIALAELAVRANRPEAILPAVERAERAGERSDDPGGARERVFESVASMIEPLLAPSAAALGGEPRAIGAEALVGGAVGVGVGVGAVTGGLAMVESLLRVMDRTANTPEQVVRQRLARGALAELRTRPVDAIASYQEILADPALSSTDWVGRRLTVRAGPEASRRVRDLMRAYGAGVYDAFETEADALSPGWARPDTEPARARAAVLARAATSYPGSRRAPALWLASGDASSDAGDALGAVTAWRSGLIAVLFRRELDAPEADLGAGPGADMGAGPGAPPADDAVAGALASRLGTELGARGQVMLAASLLAPLAEGPGASPSLTLTLPSGVTTLDSFLTDARRLASGRRFPSVGEPSGPTQLLARWTLLGTPGTSDQATDAVLLHSVPERSLALFGPGLDGTLSARWRVERDGTPTLVRVDRAWADVLWVTDPRATRPGGVLERIELATGRVAWTSPDLHGLLDALDAEREGRAIQTPLDGIVPMDQLVIAGDGAVLFVVDRVGSALALDAESGRVLWTRRLGEVTQVHRVTPFRGQMLVGGMNTEVAPGQRAEAVVVSVDTRTGESVQRYTLGTGKVRWMGEGTDGLLLVGIDEGIAAIRTEAGQAEWVCTEDAAQATVSGWTLGDRLFVLDDAGSVHLLEGDTGRVRRRGLRTDGRLRTDSGVLAWVVGDRRDDPGRGERLVLASTLGMVMYDRDGLVRGADAIDEPAGLDRRQRVGSLLTPRRTDSGFVTLESHTIMRSMDDGYRLHFVDDRSLRRERSVPVRLLALPDRIAVIDDHVLITASGATLVIPAPGVSERDRTTSTGEDGSP